MAHNNIVTLSGGKQTGKSTLVHVALDGYQRTHGSALLVCRTEEACRNAAHRYRQKRPGGAIPSFATISLHQIVQRLKADPVRPVERIYGLIVVDDVPWCDPILLEALKNEFFSLPGDDTVHRTLVLVE